MDAQRVPVTLLLGMMKRKDAAAFLRPLAQCITRLVCVPIADNDAYAPDELATIARSVGITQVTTSHMIEHTIFSANDGPGALLIAGSLFLAGEVLKNHS